MDPHTAIAAFAHLDPRCCCQWSSPSSWIYSSSELEISLFLPGLFFAGFLVITLLVVSGFLWSCAFVGHPGIAARRLLDSPWCCVVAAAGRFSHTQDSFWLSLFLLAAISDCFSLLSDSGISLFSHPRFPTLSLVLLRGGIRVFSVVPVIARKFPVNYSVDLPEIICSVSILRRNCSGNIYQYRGFETRYEQQQ